LAGEQPTKTSVNARTIAGGERMRWLTQVSDRRDRDGGAQEAISKLLPGIDRRSGAAVRLQRMVDAFIAGALVSIQGPF